nr:DUF805 domain-containing protein [Zobellella endophytica]
MKWYWQAWQLSLVFSGRASRRAFWMFFLVNLLISVALVALEIGSGAPAWVEIAYSIASFVPLIAVTVRRLHDTGRWLVGGDVFCPGDRHHRIAADVGATR